MTSGCDPEANLGRAAKGLRQAAERGCKLVILPENFALLGRREADKARIAETHGDGPIQSRLAGLCRQLGIWILAGTLPIRSDDPGRPFARSILFSDRGEVCGYYDKIHLFDVEVGADEAYRESAATRPGAKPVVVQTPWGGLGLTVCYDLRFPELYRQLRRQGATLIAAPSAFTWKTGQAHWDILVRARAIENQCYLLAANQGGEHENGRRTWGHSMLVDPWGRVLEEAGEQEAVLVHELDLSEIDRLARTFPVLSHRKLEVE